MPGRLPPAVFLERRSYRRRRLIDALRVMPVFGLCLWLVPGLWPSRPQPVSPDTGEGVAMADAMAYVFGVWAVLVIASLGLAMALRRLTPVGGEEDA